MKTTYFFKTYVSACIAMLLMVFSLSAQTDFTEFSGKVIDGKSKRTLDAVSLNVNETNISTITNSEGEFKLKVPNKFLDSKVVITLLGYNTRVLPLSELSKNGNKIKKQKATSTVVLV